MNEISPDDTYRVERELIHVLMEHGSLQMNTHNSETRLYLEENVFPSLVPALQQLLKALDRETKRNQVNEQKGRLKTTIDPLNWLPMYLMRHNVKHDQELAQHPYCQLLKNHVDTIRPIVEEKKRKEEEERRRKEREEEEERRRKEREKQKEEEEAMRLRNEEKEKEKEKEEKHSQSSSSSTSSDSSEPEKIDYENMLDDIDIVEKTEEEEETIEDKKNNNKQKRQQIRRDCIRKIQEKLQNVTTRQELDVLYRDISEDMNEFFRQYNDSDNAQFTLGYSWNTNDDVDLTDMNIIQNGQILSLEKLNNETQESMREAIKSNQLCFSRNRDRISVPFSKLGLEDVAGVLDIELSSIEAEDEDEKKEKFEEQLNFMEVISGIFRAANTKLEVEESISRVRNKSHSTWRPKEFNDDALQELLRLLPKDANAYIATVDNNEKGNLGLKVVAQQTKNSENDLRGKVLESDDSETENVYKALQENKTLLLKQVKKGDYVALEELPQGEDRYKVKLYDTDVWKTVKKSRYDEVSTQSRSSSLTPNDSVSRIDPEKEGSATKFLRRRRNHYLSQRGLFDITPPDMQRKEEEDEEPKKEEAQDDDSKEEEEASEEGSVRYNLVIPIKTKDGDVFGVLNIDSENVDDLRDRFMENTQELTDTISGAIDEVQEREDLSKIAKQACEWVKERTGANGAYFGFVSDDKIHYTAATAERQSMIGKTLERGQGVTFDAVDSGKAVIVDEVQNEERMHFFGGDVEEHDPPQEEGQVGSYMALPIRDPKNQKIVAVLAADHLGDKEGRFSPDQMDDMERSAFVVEDTVKQMRKRKKKRTKLRPSTSSDESEYLAIEQELGEKETDPAQFFKKVLQRVRGEVRNLDSKAVAELVGYNTPPKVVHRVVKAVLYILGYSKKSIGTWQQCRSIIKKDILKQISGYDPTKKQKKLKFKNGRKAVKGFGTTSVEKHGSRPAKLLFEWFQVALRLRDVAVDLRKKHNRQENMSETNAPEESENEDDVENEADDEETEEFDEESETEIGDTRELDSEEGVEGRDNEPKHIEVGDEEPLSGDSNEQHSQNSEAQDT